MVAAVSRPRSFDRLRVPGGHEALGHRSKETTMTSRQRIRTLTALGFCAPLVAAAAFGGATLASADSAPQQAVSAQQGAVSEVQLDARSGEPHGSPHHGQQGFRRADGLYRVVEGRGEGAVRRGGEPGSERLCDVRERSGHGRSPERDDLHSGRCQRRGGDLLRVHLAVLHCGERLLAVLRSGCAPLRRRGDGAERRAERHRGLPGVRRAGRRAAGARSGGSPPSGRTSCSTASVATT